MSFEPTPTRLQTLYPAILVFIGISALSIAYAAEYALKLEPCNLCFFQRIPYLIIAVIGWIGLKRPLWVSPGNLICLSGFVFLIGAGLALYHVGIEQHLWQSATGCGGQTGQKIMAAELHKTLQQKAPKSCDELDWTLFGASIASYNVFFSLVCAGVSFKVALQLWRTS